jgi:hypothetical protein
MDYIIHPSMCVDVGGVWLGFDHHAERVRRLGSHCLITYKTGALGVAPVSGKIEIPLK